MKQLIMKSLVFAVMLLTLAAYSSEEPQITKEEDNTATMVILENVQEGSLLLIKDKDGVILYKELIAVSGEYSKGFDFTNLPNADYYFELDKQESIEIIPFTVSSSTAEFVKTNEHTISKPEIIVKGDRVSISKNTIGKEPIKIEVYYEGDDLAFSEKLKDVQSVNRIYDFSNSLAGNYTILVSSEGRTFSNSIKIP